MSSRSPETTAERPTAEVGNLLPSAAESGDATAVREIECGVRTLDFRNPPRLSASELQKLRWHQTEFVNTLASRLSLFLRLEFTLKLAGIQTVTYQKLAKNWANPTCLTLFKAEPARGVGILEIAPRLGLSIVDRLMGGPGQPSDSTQAFSEVEKAILEQAAQLVVGEWCGHWHGLKELKPSILGHESNGRFVQVASPETVMLAIAMDARLGGCAEKIEIAFPYAALEGVVRYLSQGTNTVPPESAPPSPLKWNACFDEVRVPLTARWQWLEMTARDLLALKVGDVLRADSNSAGIQICVADMPRFDARPGLVAGKWAVELGRRAIN
jgi:flagellar motor switch protein FliM